MLESATLRQQAANNTKEQFATSPDLSHELNNAIIEALSSPELKDGILKILLEHSGLWGESAGDGVRECLSAMCMVFSLQYSIIR